MNDDNDDDFLESLIPYLEETEASIGDYGIELAAQTYIDAQGQGHIKLDVDPIKYLHTLLNLHHYIGAQAWTLSMLTDNSPKLREMLEVEMQHLQTHHQQRKRQFTEALERRLQMNSGGNGNGRPIYNKYRRNSKPKETTSGGPPEDERWDDVAPGGIDPATGQHRDYWVLPEAERAKGFIRPVRREYTHIVCGGHTEMGLAIAETYARDPSYYQGTFCATCKKHYPNEEFVWKDTDDFLGK